MRRTSGFTLIEVLVALLLGAIGLLGTLAVQQAVISASKTANDSAVALRLASQKLEEFSTVLTTGDPTAATGNPADAGTPHTNVDQLSGMATGNWTPTSGMPVNAEGIELATGKAPEYRWTRMWRVVNLGYGQPYVISVAVTYYASDTGNPKTVRLDMERRKSW